MGMQTNNQNKLFDGAQSPGKQMISPLLKAVVAAPKRDTTRRRGARTI